MGFLSDSGVLEVIGLDKVFGSIDEASTAFKNFTINAKRARKTL
jgi:hypothetical protein